MFVHILTQMWRRVKEITTIVDDDKDNVSAESDGNDAHTDPSAIEIFDGLDNNCDNQIDDRLTLICFFVHAESSVLSKLSTNTA